MSAAEEKSVKRSLLIKETRCAMTVGYLKLKSLGVDVNEVPISFKTY